MAATSSSVSPRVRARWPSFSPASTFLAASNFATPALSRLASFSRRGMRLLNRGDIGQDELGLDGVHVGLRIHLAGHMRRRPGRRRSARPPQMASVSRMFARNWLPRPSPWLAPATRPAMSTNSTVAGTIFAGWSISASACRRYVGHRHDAHVGLDGGERVIGGQTALVGHRREQRGLADIRQPHDTD